MQIDRPTREQEAQHYWRIMRGSLATTSLTEYRNELDALQIHCQSPTLRSLCEKSVHRFDHIAVLRPARFG